MVGILALIGGFGAILVAAVASVTIAIFVGAVMLGHGIRMRHSSNRRWQDLLTAILTVCGRAQEGPAVELRLVRALLRRSRVRGSAMARWRSGFSETAPAGRRIYSC